MSRTCAVIRYS